MSYSISDTMPHYNYGFNLSRLQGAEIAKAQQYNIDASFKDLCAVCDNVRGKTAEDAVKYLESVADGFPVAYKRWNKHLGHRRELGGKKGRYPVKAAKFVAMVLRNAVANATSKGMSATKVVHAAANKQATYPRMQSKGRQMHSDYETARVEIILVGAVSEEAKKDASVKKFIAEEAGKKREEIKTAVQKVKEEKKETAPEKQAVPSVAKLTQTKPTQQKQETKPETKQEAKQETKPAQTKPAQPNQIKKAEKKETEKKKEEGSQKK